MAGVNPVLMAILIVILVVTIGILVIYYANRNGNINMTSFPSRAACVFPPETPVGITITNPQADLLSITWTPLASVESYQVYISDVQGFSIENALNTKITSTTSVSFGNLILGKTYYIRMKATNPCGDSGLSSEVGFNIPYKFPTRFVLANRLSPQLQVCDSHTNFFGASDQAFVSRFCTFDTAWMYYDENEQTLNQSSRPNHCLTRVSPNQIWFNTCNSTVQQKWVYNVGDNTLCSALNPSTDCLKLGTPHTSDFGPAIYGAKSTDDVTDWIPQAV